jgi:sulfite reductase (ferredoxin)
MGSSGTGKPSKVEGIKLASEYLAGFVSIEALNSASHYTEDAATILKFHGSYQQDDRDLRTQMKRDGKEKAYQMMVRTRVPGGKVTAEQYLAHDALARAYGDDTIRITTRQGFQLHGILKGDMTAVIRRINETLLSTLAACGDVERNVLCCPAPIQDAVRAEMQNDCDAFASHFAPRSRSYWDIWLDGEKIDNPLLPMAGPIRVPTAGDDPIEPIYGKAYLPRKFKTAFALPDDNCTDVHANDLGFLAVIEDGRLAGYNVMVGGGLGTTPSAGKTFPALGQELAFVPRDGVLEVGEAIVKVYRDLGDRSDRKRARLKYVIHDMGLTAFRTQVEQYVGRPLHDPRPIVATDVDDHLGWRSGANGKLYLGIPVENGRIKDDGTMRLASGLRTFFGRYGASARLTCQQSILLIDLEASWKQEIESFLEEFGIATVEQVSTVRRWSMACPALPTCGLAVTEAERALPTLIDRLEVELDRLELAEERFTVRMTGCPNGCARPYNADIGLVGRSAEKNADGTNNPGSYTIFLGGSTVGERLNVIYKDYVPFDQVVSELVPVFSRFKEERLSGEPLGDFCARVGVESLRGVAPVESA